MPRTPPRSGALDLGKPSQARQIVEIRVTAPSLRGGEIRDGDDTAEFRRRLACVGRARTSILPIGIGRNDDPRLRQLLPPEFCDERNVGCGKSDDRGVSGRLMQAGGRRKAFRNDERGRGFVIAEHMIGTGDLATPQKAPRPIRGDHLQAD